MKVLNLIQTTACRFYLQSANGVAEKCVDMRRWPGGLGRLLHMLSALLPPLNADAGIHDNAAMTLRCAMSRHLSLTGCNDVRASCVRLSSTQRLRTCYVDGIA